MTDEMIVLQCSPILAGMKTGSMFSCPYTSRKELLDDIRSLNKRLVPRGIRVQPLPMEQRAMESGCALGRKAATVMEPYLSIKA